MRYEVEDGEPQRALATAALADNAENLTAIEVQGDVVDRLGDYGTIVIGGA
jgi:hypothetical protein